MSVAFGHSRPKRRAFIPHGKSGFTLTELVVTIGIVALLAGILLPVMSHVWESARRTKCAANLREVGKACMAFADRHNGNFPVCYRMRDTASASYPYYVPFCIPQGAQTPGQPDPYTNDANQKYWSIWGTSWTEWQSCGANLDIFSCPSATGSGAYATDLTSTNPEWGAVVFTNFMYVGGLSNYPLPTIVGVNTNTSAQGGNLTGNTGTPTQAQTTYAPTHSVANWGTAEPAVQTSVGPLQQGGRT